MTTNASVLYLSKVSKDVATSLDTYRRVRGIYERTEIAMGRVPRYRVTNSSTSAMVVGDVKQRTT